MNAINPLLSLIVISTACFGLAAWNSPDWLGWAATRLLARRHALSVMREAHEHGLKVWKEEVEAREV